MSTEKRLQKLTTELCQKLQTPTEAAVVVQMIIEYVHADLIHQGLDRKKVDDLASVIAADAALAAHRLSEVSSKPVAH